jgi:15-cis-phytoene synthase
MTPHPQPQLQPLSSALSADQQLCLAYAAARFREPLAALFRIDEHLAQIALGAREPMVARIKLAWWREQGFARGIGDLAAELETLCAASNKSLVLLGRIAEGWDALIAADEDKAQALADYAKERGGALLELAVHLSGANSTSERDDAGQAWDDAGQPWTDAGQAWALCDVSYRHSDVDLATLARSEARALFRIMDVSALRSLPLPLGILAILARSDATRNREGLWRPGSPVRMGRAMWFALMKQ